MTQHYMLAWLCAFARCAPVLALFPPLNWWAIPAWLRLAVAAAVSWPAAIAIAGGSPGPQDIAAELLIGLAAGAVVSMPFWAPFIAGTIAERLSAPSPPYASASYLITLGIFAALRGPTTASAALISSFRAIPPGHLDLLARAPAAAAEMLGAALLLALPLLGSAAIAHLAYALATRSVRAPLDIPAAPLLAALGLAGIVALLAGFLTAELAAATALLSGG